MSSFRRPLTTVSITALLAGAIWLPTGCGSDSSGTSAAGGGPKPDAGNDASTDGQGGGSGDGGGGTAGVGGTLSLDGGDCECDSGVCINNVCCPEDLACGMTCCAAGDVCSFQMCATPGMECVDSDECGADQYCEFSLGDSGSDGGVDGGDAGDGGTCQGGVTLPTGRCLPKPPQCAPGQEPGDPLDCIQECEYKPPPGTFAPQLKHHWDKGQIMMSPIVVQLDDDNCDGKVDDKDIPEILFSTFEYTKPATGDNGGAIYSQNGTLHAISVVGGQLVDKWSYSPDTPFDNRVHPGTHLAGGNIDGQPGNEVIVCTQNGRTRALNADGTELWLSTIAGCFMPSIADLDQDGTPEVLSGAGVLDGATGATKFPVAGGAFGTFADVTGDGYLDVVTGRRVYDRTGALLADVANVMDTSTTPATPAPLVGSYTAIGDFDKDTKPEIVLVDYASHSVHIWQYDPNEPNSIKVIRRDIDMNGTFTNNCAVGSAGETRGGGPPTIGDFNGDGTPDVAVATGIGYTVLDGTKLLDSTVPNNQTNLWLKETKDCSSAATGSSVFDFDGDGKPEVVYADEHTLRIYDGTNGDELWSTCNTSGTLTEYPLVADVDNDGHADLIVIANDYSGLTCLPATDPPTKVRGVRIYGDTTGKWVRTRSIWNQHTYHVTNVNEDGSIPQVEEKNWTHPRLNNFRQNIQPSGEFNAPDLVVQVRPRCTNDYGLIARVRNIGLAKVPAGVVVGFYEGDPAAGGTRLGEGVTTQALGPAESTDVAFAIPMPSAALTSGATQAYAKVDDGGPPHAWVECRDDNNTSAGESGACDVPK